MTRAGFWLNMVIATVGILALVAMTGFFGYKWLAADEPDRAHHCGSGSRGGMCLEGETINMILTFVFGGITLVLIVLCAQGIRDRRRR